MRMQGQVAVVTGAASGLGRSIAMRYAAEGAAVVVADLDAGAGRAVVEAIEKAGGRGLAIAMDVTDEAAVDRGVAATMHAFGRLDVMVSNAGIQIVHPVEEFSFAEWRRMMSIHVDGAFLVTKASLPHMYAQGSGSLIYMGSVHSKLASPLKAPYVAAKHALIGLARTVAKEGGKRGVRANVICPGFVRTPLVEKQIPEQAAAFGISEAEVVQKIMLKDTVDGEFTSLDDVAEVAVLFASFPSNALTGQSLIVSHGWHME